MGRKAKPYSSFVEEVKKIHGDKYSYDESSYKGTNSLVAVLCPIHGNFQQWGHHLLKGRGCRDCAVEEGQASRRPYSEQEFLQKLEEVHRGKIALIGPYGVGDLLLFCKEHGSEFQKSSSFLIDRKQGCRGCYLDKVRLSFEEFEERALTLHKHRYSYVSENFIGAKGTVKVICSTHGPFVASVKTHLGGGGLCPDCVKLSKSLNQRLPFDAFVEKANKVHRNKYHYDENSYEKATSKIAILCPSHGWFQQKGTKHLVGNGCPACGRQSRGEEALEAYFQGKAIAYEKEKSFGLRGVGGGVLRFDFFLPALRVLIEYDGPQHFRPTSFFGALSEEEALRNFIALKANDELKNTWAKREALKLYRFSSLTGLEEELDKMIETHKTEADKHGIF